MFSLPFVVVASVNPGWYSEGRVTSLRMLRQSILTLSFLGAAALWGGCRSLSTGSQLPRRGDEIVVAGQLFHTGTRVVTWIDPGGYDAYRVERRFSPLAESGWEASRLAEKSLTTPNRYNMRHGELP